MPVIVLADASGSMDGDKIIRLNESIGAMIRAFAMEDSGRGEIHVAVVAFGGAEAVLHQPMTPASRTAWNDLAHGGRTPMGSAFRLAQEILDDPELVPDRAFPPALVLVSDGMPTDADWDSRLDALLSSKWGSRALRVAVGIGTDRTDEAEQVLRTFSTPGVGVLRTDQVHDINGLFRWVTATVTSALHERTGQRAVRLEEFD
ncbi:VWA domain-containing protein [Dactylosporangium vinaceum]|uniref:VWA domain-containing protein n=1 Tax=Dactylosporangium vinaceum TaxID=53362 RepID=A0ABV5M3M7_9ACTN|nr:VWA domain-containing protein [Dactylosporangium vinaceum]UAB94429.1 VWA domain-containing protein [Dactylosporangium vinaceum]